MANGVSAIYRIYLSNVKPVGSEMAIGPGAKSPEQYVYGLAGTTLSLQRDSDFA